MVPTAKEQIVSAFLDLLQKKPLDKLTVTDIVQASGVTRQTFYYHFQDIPALITFIVCRYADDVGSRAARASNAKDVIRLIFSPIWECPDLVCQLMEAKKYPAGRIIFTEVRGHMVRLFRLRRLEIGMGHLGMETAATYYAYAALGIIKTYCQLDYVEREPFVEQMCRLVRGDMFQDERFDWSENQQISQEQVYQRPQPRATSNLF